MSRPIYTPNAIEGFNRQLRKVPKAKSVFPQKPAETALPSHDGHHEKKDRTAAGLEPDPRPADYLFRRVYARVTSDVKDFANGFATLYIHPNGVVIQTGRQPIKPAPALDRFCSIRTPNGVYTKIWDCPKGSYLPWYKPKKDG